MFSAAVLGTEQVISSGLCGGEPNCRVAPRDRVLFDSKCRHKEAVDYILRRHGDANSPLDRDVQLIDLALSGWMLQLPHPLLTCRENLEGVLRRDLDVEIDAGSPGKHCHE